jgi:hypothetical protein
MAVGYPGEQALNPIYEQLVDQGLKSGSLRAYASGKLIVELELLPHGKISTVAPNLSLTPRTDFYAAEAFSGFASAKLKRRTIVKPPAIESGDFVGRQWGRLGSCEVAPSR